MTATVSRTDALTVVKQLAAGRDLGFVQAANRHLTAEQIRLIATSHGYPDPARLAWAVDVLAKQIAEAEMAAIRPAAVDQPLIERVQRTGQRRPPTPPRQPESPMTAQPATPIGQPMRPYEATAMLLLEGKESTSKRTVALAGKIEDLLVDLRDRLKAEKEAKQAQQRREAERRQALEEVRRAEEALKAARDKARKFKNHPGGNGAATVTRSPSSESRRPGGLASVDANRSTGVEHMREVLDRHGVTSGQIRSWAWANGVQCPGAGRLPHAVLDAYDAAHSTDEAAG